MNRNFLKIALAALVVCSFTYADAKKKKENPADTSFIFTDVKVVPTTSVKDQNKSGTCWSFAASSFFEEELLRMGKGEIDLSEMYVVRHCYLDKGKKYVRYYGQTNFAAGGGLVDVAYVWKNYGIVPDSVYTGLEYGEEKHVHGELDALLSNYVKQIVKNPNKKLSSAWYQGYEGIVDAYLGAEPKEFEYKGVKYTPKSFAEHLGLNMDDYMMFTSYTHHPFYEPFILEIPDNWLNASYINLPLAEMKEIVDNAIDNGYTVLWAADVSEPGFKWYDGVALMPKKNMDKAKEGTELSRWVKLRDSEKEEKAIEFKGPVEEIEVTQESRQEGFDNYETTDDHGMVIVGKAVDQKGNKYYKVKNSWDSDHIYKGFFYVSEPYFLAKTMGIMVNKAAVPTVTLDKLK